MSRKISLGRWLGSLVAAIAMLYLILSVAGGAVLLEGALRVPRRPVAQRSVLEATVSPWASRVEDATVAASDGAALKGWFVQPRAWNGETVLLLHGVGDNRQGVMHYAPMFLRSGYAVLLPDSRAHGDSDGDHATYGLLELDDVHRWLHWVKNRESGASGCLYLLGESMGAGIALQAAEESEVCAVVAEAPFASFREIGYERIAQGLGTSVEFSHVAALPMVNAAFIYARLRYGLKFDEASPERRLAASHVPALLIAGLEDRNIPPRHAKKILKQADAQCELWLVPGAGHTTAASTAPVEFERRVLAWFAAHPRQSR